MEIEYRKLSEKELDVFIEMRINQLREEVVLCQDLVQVKMRNFSPF